MPDNAGGGVRKVRRVIKFIPLADRTAARPGTVKKFDCLVKSVFYEFYESRDTRFPLYACACTANL